MHRLGWKKIAAVKKEKSIFHTEKKDHRNTREDPCVRSKEIYVNFQNNLYFFT